LPSIRIEHFEEIAMLFCGLDVGTTGVKAVVFDEKGSRHAAAYRAYDLAVTSDGTRLLRGAEIWDRTKEVLAEVTVSCRDIAAISAASFGEAFVALDKENRIICDPMLFTDRWGEDEYAAAEKKTSAAEVAAVCGLPLSPSYSLSRVLYLKERRPGVYEKIDKILLMQDFINFMLSGERTVDYSTACRTMFFDVRSCAWSDDLIAKFGLEKRHYSEPRPMGSESKISKKAAAELGLDENVKIVLGGHDQPVNAIGSGLRAGYAVCSMGTSECITPILKGILPADFISSRGIPMEPLWDKGKFCAAAYNTCSGLLVQWFFKTFSGEKDPPYALFEEEQFPREPTRIMVQPYLMGSGTPYMDSGARLAVTGIDYGTTKFDLYRAVLEGLVLDQRLNMAALKEVQVTVDHLIAVGGGSKSRVWRELKADILQIPVSVLTVKEAGTLGSAILCAAAAGIYGSIEEAAGAMSHTGETIDPNPRHRDFYAEKFELYRRLHDHVKEESAFALKTRI
jgi:xylulokinase